jgi:hypothetical protein
MINKNILLFFTLCFSCFIFSQNIGVTEINPDLISLGKEEESGNHLLGKIIKNCNDKIKDITLDNFPTLIEK